MTAASRLSRFALATAIIAALLWPLSYAWLVVALVDGRDPAWLFPMTLVGEIGALASGLLALVAGSVARRRPAVTDADRRRAAIGAFLGGTVAVLVVGLNLLFMLVLA